MKSSVIKKRRRSHRIHSLSQHPPQYGEPTLGLAFLFVALIWLLRSHALFPLIWVRWHFPQLIVQKAPTCGCRKFYPRENVAT